MCRQTVWTTGIVSCSCLWMGVFLLGCSDVADQSSDGVFLSASLHVGHERWETESRSSGCCICSQVNMAQTCERFWSQESHQKYPPMLDTRDISMYAHLPAPHQSALHYRLLSCLFSKWTCKREKLKYSKLNVHILPAYTCDAQHGTFGA